MLYLQKTESLVYEDDSDGIDDYENDSDEHVDLEDVSDNDSDVSGDSQAKQTKRKVSRSSEEIYTEEQAKGGRKAKRRRLSTSDDSQTTDPESATSGQESLDESAWGMSYISLYYYILYFNF